MAENASKNDNEIIAESSTEISSIIIIIIIRII